MVCGISNAMLYHESESIRTGLSGINKIGSRSVVHWCPYNITAGMDTAISIDKWKNKDLLCIGVRWQSSRIADIFQELFPLLMVFRLGRNQTLARLLWKRRILGAPSSKFWNSKRAMRLCSVCAFAVPEISNFQSESADAEFTLKCVQMPTSRLCAATTSSSFTATLKVPYQPLITSISPGQFQSVIYFA